MPANIPEVLQTSLLNMSEKIQIFDAENKRLLQRSSNIYFLDNLQFKSLFFSCFGCLILIDSKKSCCFCLKQFIICSQSIFLLESFCQPFQLVFAPVIQPSFGFNQLHAVMATAKHDPDYL